MAASGSVEAAPQKKAPAPAVKKALAPKPPAPKPYVIPTAGILNGDDLIAVAHVGEKGAADEFSDDPSLQFVGREFVVSFPKSEFSTSYDKEAKILTLRVYTYNDGWKLLRQVNRSEYVGQNAYGAKAVISKTAGKAYGIEIPKPRSYKSMESRRSFRSAVRTPALSARWSSFAFPAPSGRRPASTLSRARSSPSTPS
ncbi:hypothetical protein [Caulobacter rhizosphaerae]|jgi:hypothetical protein|nr:hypothetical protein [Caulobacter rhizosphaerae]